jgi:glycosyltransferase involved in cell wall biosynthesis
MCPATFQGCRDAATFKMKIAMIGPVYPYRGGIAHYTTSLAKALVIAGHDVQAVSYRRQYPAALYPGESDKDPSLDPVRVDAKFLLDPLYPWTWLQTAQSIERSQPDLVVIQWWTTFWAPAYAALARGLRHQRPVVYLIHNVFPHEARPWDHWLAGLALGQGSAFIVQAPHEQEKLSKLIPSARISYCKLPVYERFGKELIPKDIARRQLGLPTDRPLFLFFGIVRPYKGLKYLLEAMARIDVPAHLAVAGEFWESVALYEKQLEQLGLTKKVTLINRYIPNEEAHILFSAADALVAPYVDGTQSAAVGVSLGYQLPTIVTHKIAAGVDGDAAELYTVPAADAVALAGAMTELIQSPRPPRVVQTAQDRWERLVRVIEQIAEADPSAARS